MEVNASVARLASLATSIVLLGLISGGGCRRAEQAPAQSTPPTPAAQGTSPSPPQAQAAEQARPDQQPSAPAPTDVSQAVAAVKSIDGPPKPDATQLAAGAATDPNGVAPTLKSGSNEAPAQPSASGGTSGESAPAPRQPPRDWSTRNPYRALVVTPQGPVLLALVVDIDGRPLPQVWSDRLQEVLKRADANGDGQAQWSELWKVGSIADGSYGNEPAPTEQQQYQRQQECDLDRNGVVNTSELEMLLTGTRRRSGPMQWTSNLTTDGFRDLSGTLWEWLDVDGDHRVSSDERQAISVRLEQLDLNADGAIREEEFTARTAAGRSNESDAREGRGEQLLYPIGSKTRWADMLYALELIYAGGNDLSTESMTNPPRWLKQLDQDTDQLISVDELAGCGQVDPDLLAVCRFATGQAPAMELWQLVGEPRAAWQAASSSGLAARSETVWQGLGIGVEAIDASAGPGSAEPTRPLLDQLDQDKNGQLSGAEAEQAAAALGTSLARLDANSDGMVTADELTRLLDDRNFISLATLELVLARDTDRWGGWDGNRDGMLGERERRLGDEVWRQRDRDGDGTLTADELSRTLQIRLMRGGADRVGSLPLPLRMAVPTEPAVDGTLDWLHGMDANGDGEVSWQEFGGDESAFQGLDRNQDGFLTRDEVPAAGTSG